MNLTELKRRYGVVYEVTIKRDVFVFRPLTRREYRELMENNQDNEHRMEETICSIAVISPEGYDFANRGNAGIAKILSEHIIAASGLAHPGQVQMMLEDYRERMTGFEAQAEIYISQAFHNITFEEMEDWTLDQLIHNLARAEYALQQVWQMPVAFKFAGPDEEGEAPAEEPPSLKEMGEKLRDQGLDPMFELSHMIRIKPPFMEFPMIGGTKLLSNEEALTNVREQIQRVLERRALSSTLSEE